MLLDWGFEAGQGKMLSNQGLAKTKATMSKLSDDHLQPKEPDGFLFVCILKGQPIEIVKESYEKSVCSHVFVLHIKAEQNSLWVFFRTYKTTTFLRVNKWNPALETDCKDPPPLFESSQDKRTSLYPGFALEFDSGPHCNCFTMSPLNCAVTKTEIEYGTLSHCLILALQIVKG